MRKASFVFLIFGSILLPKISFAQNDSARKAYKNQIEISYCISSNFQGRFLKWDRLDKTTRSNFPSLGISYSRLLGKRQLALELGYRRFAGGYTGPFLEPDPNGDKLYDRGTVISKRSMIYFLAFRYPFFQTPHVVFSGILDISFRKGSETIVVMHGVHSGGWTEMITEGIALRDFGLTVGTRFSWLPVPRLVVSGDLRYTRFLITHYDLNPSFPFFMGVSKNLLMWQVKLGFCF